MERALGLLVIISLAITGGCKDTKEADTGEREALSAGRMAHMAEHGESDMGARDALIAKIKAQPDAASILPKMGTVEEFVADTAKTPEPSPVVSLEDFFEGNRDLGSIGCNLVNHPGIAKFYEVLKGIRARRDVQDVLIEIYEIDEGSETWPFGEVVYILTSAPVQDVGKWMAPLQPDEVFEGWRWEKAPSAAPQLEDGIRVLGVWWD